ncbi:hypothetical protein Tco_0605963 [Tanacetum coccineum]
MRVLVHMRRRREAALEGQQQLSLVMDIATDKPLDLYGAVEDLSELALREGLVPSTFESENHDLRRQIAEERRE